MRETVHINFNIHFFWSFNTKNQWRRNEYSIAFLYQIVKNNSDPNHRIHKRLPSVCVFFPELLHSILKSLSLSVLHTNTHRKRDRHIHSHFYFSLLCSIRNPSEGNSVFLQWFSSFLRALQRILFKQVKSHWGASDLIIILDSRDKALREWLLQNKKMNCSLKIHKRPERRVESWTTE